MAAELQPMKEVTFKLPDGINRKITPIESKNGQFNELTICKQTPLQNSGNEKILKWVLGTMEGLQFQALQD